MIIRFSIKNWLSFKDQVCFSMISSQEQQHRARLPSLNKYKMKVLPIAAIYGGNASGKTNFFKALNFCKKLVVDGTRPDTLIPCEPFRLGQGAEEPSYFSFELLIEENIYEYSFSVNKKAVLEEKLVHIKSNSEKILYHRKEGKPNFDRSLQKDQFLEFAFQGTRSNQLFLNNSVSQNVSNFRPVYDWFKNVLHLIAPDSRFGSYEYFLDENNTLHSTMNHILPQLDTGIIRLGSKEIPCESIPFLGPQLQEKVKENSGIQIFNSSLNDFLLITRKNGEILAKKLVTYHQKADGTEAQFEIAHESDGSRRVIDLLPAFLDMSSINSNKVYIIDELDRSLHTHLTRQLINSFLTHCSPESRSQLLMTTHDVLLMDQKLLRRDEMWVAERDTLGISNLFSFSEFKDVRYDRDIRKSYLQGRLGGVPKILLDYAF